ncbi:hypothetical protein K4B79_18795 [Streptomyces lincolnensis]|uniref:hypothetical protein n=1 Tax=Streptomyces lincolnensis TaxID=1915 RepID=UPI001E372ACF|nr:hypothetical protein [Streptomyces lincolnensis]MCD7440264.1 hypothetical protein [Streptomyces lincolnensis]
MSEKIITARPEDLAKAELIDAIRKQTDNARTQIPREGAAALRDLAEAYAIVTTPTLPPLELSTPVDGS